MVNEWPHDHVHGIHMADCRVCEIERLRATLVVKAVTARCSDCGSYCDDIEWEYETLEEAQQREDDQYAEAKRAQDHAPVPASKPIEDQTENGNGRERV